MTEEIKNLYMTNKITEYKDSLMLLFQATHEGHKKSI